MINVSKPSIKLIFGISLFLGSITEQAWGQCQYFQVTHLTGTEQVGCNEVTVTSEGSVDGGNFCGHGPHAIGTDGTGSYIFTFSPPVQEVLISFSVLNNAGFGVEELSVEVNGAFYPIINPGTFGGCGQNCNITGTGTIQCGPGDIGFGGSWQDLTITETITTIKITDVWLSGEPNGVPLKVVFCCVPCPVDAGSLTGDATNLCPYEAATVPPASQTNLEANDLLQYILFSDLNDTLGSIVKTSNNPSFMFTSSNMQTDVTYYIAAIAGNSVNGNVDLTDPCISISNAIPFTWYPLPTVAFSAINPDVCPGDCTDITATLTGTAPFTLTYTTPGAGPFTQTFSGNSGTFSVCSEVGSPPGNFLLQATTLADRNCTCQ
jgi:hypothetical protein